MKQTIKPFSVAIPQTQLDDLNARLANTRWPNAETVDDWSQGAPLAAVKSLCEYWQHSYDWRRCERELNQYPQFTTEIDGLDIHFLHIRSPHENALPMIMTHGWPGSILEFMKVIGPLTNPTAHGGSADDAFHLVIPSLPGYGFSGKPTGTGWGLERIAKAWINLMARLEYSEFVAQGGDWGSFVTSAIGQIHPPQCRAIHINMALAQPTEEDMASLSERDQKALADMKYYFDSDSGYAMIQKSRPQSIGYGLADSPAAQAAWIYEKFHRWTDNNGHPEDALSVEQMLDDISIYWLTNSAASSARLYWESFESIFSEPVSMPCGVSIFPKELFRPARKWAERIYQNLIHWNELDKGGHFAAFEQPEIFVNEVRSCFAKVR
ncbi:pimeloyl-ACP methyl ester carboxylesterase [Zhongshania antarctica]|uniref:Pimeloyl-ACP methyl ester carboxylesterase n=1 Tax=Zhongshania antarctica TaxID=641702 RepID=A0A840R3Y6_9GAMM|nr:epoxide hydrolase family protein [Zhongshania antarctica]MBB5187132.1 pimeloyl-ACP methyl ester carboxylesterase [Zhongshania antarctica]